MQYCDTMSLCNEFLSAEFVPLALLFTTVEVASVYGYTTWASTIGKDFNYLAPITLSRLSILITAYVVQVPQRQSEFTYLI